MRWQREGGGGSAAAAVMSSGYGGTLMVLTLKETENRYRISTSSVLPIFNIRCSCQLVNSNIQVGVAARNIEFSDNLANFDS
jgi:hypothetical protein